MNTLTNNRKWSNIYCCMLLLYRIAATQGIQLTSPSAHNNSSAVKLLCPGSSIGSPTYCISCSLLGLYFRVFDLETSESILYANVCVLTVLLVTERLDSCVVFLQTLQIYVLSSRETYRHGRMGELPIIWCCFSCIIPSKWGGRWRSHGAEQLKIERERAEAALSVGISM